MRRLQVTGLRVWFAAVLVVVVVAACGAPSAETPAGDASVAAEVAATEAPAQEAPAVTAAPTEAPATEPAAEQATAEQATAEQATAEPAAEPAASAEAAALTFTIDPAQSRVSYAVAEEFLGQALSFVTTVGTTSAIDGSLQITVGDNSVALGSNEFTVDLRTLTSDSPRRDNALRGRWLQSDTYPFAVFQATEVAGLPADAALGVPVSFKLNGNITIREITQPITWDVTATLDGSTLSGTAQSQLMMADFGFQAPDIAGMLKVTDGVTLTLEFVAQEGQ